jgi:hypothetical protein
MDSRNRLREERIILNVKENPDSEMPFRQMAYVSGKYCSNKGRKHWKANARLDGLFVDCVDPKA